MILYKERVKIYNKVIKACDIDLKLINYTKLLTEFSVCVCVCVCHEHSVLLSIIRVLYCNPSVDYLTIHQNQSVERPSNRINR